MLYNQFTGEVTNPSTGIVLSAQSGSATPPISVEPASQPLTTEASSSGAPVGQSIAGSASCQTTAYSNTPAVELSSLSTGFTSQIDSPAYYHPVAGKNLTEIYNNVTSCARQQSGLNGYHGATSYTLKWSYATSKAQTGLCRLDNLKVAVRITQLLPYIDPSSLPEGLGSVWLQRFNQLVAHENEHSAIDHSNARRLYDQLNGLHEDCSTLNAKAEAYIKDARQQITSANSTLDATSSHGTR